MKFRSELEIRPIAAPIDYPSSVLLMGSCFTEHMGERLDRDKLPVLQNPNGILFNPVSIGRAVVNYIDKKIYGPQDLFHLNERWNSWDHHSRFSHPDPAACLEGINESQAKAHAFLKAADWALVTLGSAFVYELKETRTVVANCHKAPADWFTRRLLGLEELLSSLDNLIHRLFFFNPTINILFTISPVRHLREGLIDNNRSKALLIQAVHHLTAKFSRIDYFPAYELVIDDLRDYRFYAEDLTHPNYQATQYVWEKFMEGCMTGTAREIIKALDPLLSARRHKPFNAASEGHRQFLRRNAEAAEALQRRYPFLDLSGELAYFSRTET